ncbi:MAG: exodeoxyribonuclease V subunit beta [Gammaproteobacteria bacterium]|nr:exodeoxyribonuclease V subunit beta [Gammaproteobacteria bacterium]
MSAPRPLDIFAAALDTSNLVEASAGTGKTYAIAGLYLRLVVEAGLRVSDILVVTYTQAATEELKERVRTRLVEARRAFQQGTSEDPIYHCLLQRHGEDRAAALRRLNNAILAFDEAAIYTIHGFCQRVLNDSAFASKMPFENEIAADESGLLQEIVEDFWRRRLHDVPSLLAQHIVNNGLTPEALRQSIQPYLNKPYLMVAELEEIQDLGRAEEEFQTAFFDAAQQWRTQREAVTELLLHSDALNRRTYNQNMPAWFVEMDSYLNESEYPEPKPFEKFVNFTTDKLRQSQKKNKTSPAHPFFNACDVLLSAGERLQNYFKQYLQILRYELLSYCNEELPRRKRRRQVQSYDDLLLNLRKALLDPQRGEHLAETLRMRYQAALIDEFQDTDPTQYTIFQTIYRDAKQALFLVGDPKQAIYSFRGADIFAYLRAKQNAGAEYTLDTNWRSDPDLIKAINALFSLHPHPFWLKEIPFHPVEPAQKPRPKLVVGDNHDAPLTLWFVPPDEKNKRRTKGWARDAIVQATAGRIARLLMQGESGDAYFEDGDQRRPLSGGDIAVLVRTHREAGQIRKALLAVGIPSVQHSRDSVFDTPEAVELERVLLAIAEPQRENIVRAALITDLLGYSGETLEALMDHDREWEETLQMFDGYHQLWREQGFMRMFRALLTDQAGYERLLGFRDGERRLTNILHLGELLQEADMEKRLGMEGLLQWLAAQRDTPSVAEDNRQLRLESDADLVKIVTIHKSKGLEYPIVFCPFLWDGDLKLEDGRKQTVISFHDPENDYQAVLDIGSPLQEQRRPHAVREELAENLRLAYVALTRAQYRCYTVFGAVKDAEASALAWLLFRPTVLPVDGDALKAQRELVSQLNEQALRQGLRDLVTASHGTVRIEDLPGAEGEHYRPERRDDLTLRARAFGGHLRRGWYLTSFSALQERRSVDLPDYDADPSAVNSTEDDLAQRSIFTFPRGTRAGRCLHTLFERLDFTDGKSMARITQETLAQYGYEDAWTPIITEMVARVLAAPLDSPAVALRQVALTRRLTELGFAYRFERLEVDALQSLLEAHGAQWKGLLTPLNFKLPGGFMQGFIDLVFEAAGKVYLVDYKSSWLGPRLEDYQPSQLATAMAAGSYPLQYLIYTVALHRYLRWRRPGYDYDRHFGGVRYLFLRGIHPERPDNGIYSARPPAALITALENYLLRQGAIHD